MNSLHLRKKVERRIAMGVVLGLGLLWCGALLGAACGGSSPPPPQPGVGPGAPAAPTPEGATAPGPGVKLDLDMPEETPLVDTFIYTSVGKRDPFKSPYKELTVKKPENTAGPSEILTTFDLDQLKLVAVISGIPQPKAMVEDPTGKGYVVKIGTRMGKNFGRIVRIRANEIIVAEDYRDWSQRLVTNYIHVALDKEKEKEAQ